MAKDGYRVEALRFSPKEAAPNSRFPLLVYRGAVTLDPGTDPAETIISIFRQHNWLNNWRYPGIYDYYHFHSTSHEVLGVAQGEMTLRLGGEDEADVSFAAGDVIVMPAGVSHAFIDGTSDILVVGGYADGRDWDLLRDGMVSEADWRAALKLIMSLPIPDRDPVTGEAMQQWRQAPSSLEWGAPREELDPV